ncbi:hypothetical protein [Bdellovibrio sp. HCB274]|uniref:hypothetical protein n=1 Tax=Bdellovibrio sp. HCB274 TaxID=3394361 RepID=UPI0039B6D419
MELELVNGTLSIDKKNVSLPEKVKQVLEYQGLIIVVLFPKGSEDNNVWALNAAGEVVWKVPVADLPGSRFNYYSGAVLFQDKLRLFHQEDRSYFVNPVDGTIKRADDSGRPW